jgi:hypothetical protein
MYWSVQGTHIYIHIFIFLHVMETGQAFEEGSLIDMRVLHERQWAMSNEMSHHNIIS